MVLETDEKSLDIKLSLLGSDDLRREGKVRGREG
jgi:hypothetical protein